MTPAVIHFCGLIPGAAADEAGLRAGLAEVLRPVGHGFGGLAAGADIAVAEALLAQGAAVTAVLPFPPAPYAAHSVRPGGEAWVARFEACLARVELHVLGSGFRGDGDYAPASRRAMELVRLAAGRRSASCWQLAVWDGAGGSGPAGTAADVRGWLATGGRTLVMPSPWPRRGAALPA